MLVRDAIEGNWNRVPEDLSNYQLVLQGDLVLNKMKAWQGSLGISGERGIVSPAYYVYSPLSSIAESRFLHYQLRSKPFIEAYGRMSDGIRTDQWDLDSWAFSRMNVYLPSPPEQVAIADFLDRETAKIDALIREQKKLIAILQQRRRDTVWATVTGGSAFDASLALEGRNLPIGWTVCRVHYDYEVVLGKMLDSGRPAVEDEIPAPYVRAANVQDSGLDLADMNAMPFRPSELIRLSLRRGDLLVVEGGASYGKSVWLETDLPGWGFQKTINRVRSRGAGSTRFLGYVLQGLRDRGILALQSDGSTLPHLTAETLRGLRVPRPPTGEQERLADFLDVEIGTVRTLTAKVEEFILLTRERRAALITAAVTGQLDVSTGKVA